MPRHGLEHAAKVNTEKLPDITGTMITYASGVEITHTTTDRVTSEPTVTAGSTGELGTIESMTAKCLPAAKLNGVVCWELVTVFSENS